MADRARAGFTLAEVIVALALLSVGVLAVAAAGLSAARLVTGAHRDEFLAATLASLADSLATGSTTAGGEIDRGRMTVAWSSEVSADSLTLTIRATAKLKATPDSASTTIVRVLR